MKRILALVAVAGAAALAQGQTSVLADLQVNDGSGWSNLVSVPTGAVVDVRVSIQTTAANFFAWGGATFSQFSVANSAASDAAGTFAGKLQPTTQTYQLAGAGTAGAKIDRLDNPAGNIQLAQLGLSFGGDPANPIVAFTFKYTVGSVDSRDIIFSLPAGGYTLATYFNNGTTGNSSIAAANRSFDGATIRVIPAPGALALVGLSGLVAGRRRRA